MLRTKRPRPVVSKFQTQISAKRENTETPVVFFLGKKWYPDKKIDKYTNGLSLMIRKAKEQNHQLCIRCDYQGKSAYGSFNDITEFNDIIFKAKQNKIECEFFQIIDRFMPCKIFTFLTFPESYSENDQLEIIKESFDNLFSYAYSTVFQKKWQKEKRNFHKLSDSKYLFQYNESVRNFDKLNQFWTYAHHLMRSSFQKDHIDWCTNLIYYKKDDIGLFENVDFVQKEMIDFQMNMTFDRSGKIQIPIIQHHNPILYTTSKHTIEIFVEKVAEQQFDRPINLKHLREGLKEIDFDLEIEDEWILNNFIPTYNSQCIFHGDSHYDDYDAYQYLRISYDGSLQYCCTAKDCEGRAKELTWDLFNKKDIKYPPVDLNSGHDHPQRDTKEWFDSIIDLDDEDDETNGYYGIEDIIECIDKKDIGLSDILSKVFMDRIKITNGGKNCYIWNGKIWKKDDSKTYHTLVAKSIQTILDKTLNKLRNQIRHEEKGSPQHKHLQNLIKRFNQILDKNNSGSTQNVTNFAMKNFYDENFESNMNNHKYKIIAKNGMIDLKRGRIVDPLPHDNLTVQSDFNFHHCSCPLGKCGLKGVKCDSELDLDFIEKKFRELMNDDEELYNHLRWIIGYVMTGDPKKKLAFIWYGKKYNGKSLLSNLLIKVFPMYASAMEKSVVIKMKDKAAGQASPELVALQGVRAAILNETGENDIINEEQVKMITGGDTKNLRQMYGTNFDMDFDFAPLVCTNHKPRISITDPAIWERICPALFPVSFLPNPDPNNKFEKKADDNLKSKLMSHSNQERFFNWVIRCCLYYCQNEGKKYPEFILNEIKKYKRECNLIYDFIEDNKEIYTLKDNMEVPLKTFRQHLNDWCRKLDLNQPRQNKFIEMLQQMRCEVIDEKGEETLIRGIGLSQVINGNYSAVSVNVDEEDDSDNNEDEESHKRLREDDDEIGEDEENDKFQTKKRKVSVDESTVIKKII